MGVSSTTSRVTYTGNGATSVYSYPFRIFQASDLVVTKRLISTGVETTLALTTDYTVSGVGAFGGGNVTLVAGALASTYVLVIRRVRPLTQLTDIRNQSAFYASSHEDTFDSLVMIDQTQQDAIDRSVKLPQSFTTSDFDPTLPAGSVGAVSTLLSTNASGNGLALGPTVTAINAAIAQAAAAQASTTATMGANAIKGNNTGSPVTPLDLTAAQVAAMLPVVVGDSGSGGTKGLAPAPGSGDAAAGKFLKADGTWTVPPSAAGITSLTGDVTGTGPGATGATIAANAVSNAKLAQMPTNTLKGNNTGGSANASDLSAAQANALLSTITALTGDVTATGAGGSTSATIAANAVTNAKAAQMAAHTYKGNNSGSTANASDVSAANVLADISPLTSKGDLATFSTVNARLGVGTNNQVLTADSTQSTGLKWANSAGGGGSKNYLAIYTASTAGGVANTGNGDFELGTTTGWALGNVALTNNFPSGVPTFGSGASGNLSIAAITSSQLAGTTSMSYVSSAATTAGNFVASNAFFIDLEDQAKCLTFSFAYNAFANPLNANWSGTSSNSYGVAIYDVTNSVWIMPAGCFGMTQSSGVGICTGTFQTSSNGTQYRICLYNANATSGGVTTYLDDFKIGPQTAPIGAVITAWQAYPAVPASQGFGTLTNPTQLEWMREGSDCLIRGNFTTGTLSGVEGRIGLPTGLTSADTTVIPATQICGVWENNSVGAASSAFVLIQPSVTYVNFGFRDASNAPLTLQLGNALTGNTTTISMQARVPIQGWGGGTVQMSNDTDTRVCAASYYMSANQSVTANSASVYANFDTKEYDTHAAVTTTSAGTAGTWRFTAPISGIYSVKMIMAQQTTLSTTNYMLFKNGVAYKLVGALCNTTNSVASGVTEISLNAGDYIFLNAQNNVGLQGGALSANVCQIQISRLSGPSVVASTETVAAHYAVNTGTSVTVTTQINFDSKVIDTHSAVTTGASWKFTSPISGKFLVSGSVYSGVTGNNLFIYKNGSLDSLFGVSTSSAGPGNNAHLLQLNAGDTIDIRPSASGTLTSLTPGSTTQCNFVSIVRVGN